MINTFRYLFQKPYYVLLFINLLFSNLVFSQYTVKEQGFDGSGDWNHTSVVNNGSVMVVDDIEPYNTASTATPDCLVIIDYYTPSPTQQTSMILDQVNISGLNDVKFSMDYASLFLSATDQLRLIYSIDGNAPITIVLIQGGSGDVVFSDNANNGTALANPYELNIGTGSTLDITIEGFSDNNGGQERFYIDDLKLTGSGPDPIAKDDELSVKINSVAGIENQVIVSANDYIGDDEGSDGDDYSISATPLITAKGGSVTEITDGVFEYIPETDYIGSDSFLYTICDAGGDCSISTVNVFIDNGACKPTSISSGSHYIDNFSMTGEGSSINNTSGDNNGYSTFYNLPVLSLQENLTYTASANLVGPNMGWGIYIDFNKDGDFDDDNEAVGHTGGEGIGDLDIKIPNNALPGKTIMRVGARRYFWPEEPCGNTDDHPEEFEDYIVDIIQDFSPLIVIKAKGVFVDVGASSSSLEYNTKFGLFDIGAGPLVKSYELNNEGDSDLILSGTPAIELTDSGDGSSIDFYTTNFPSGTILEPGQSLSFDIVFDPSVVDNREALISIKSNDPYTPDYNFKVDGEGADTYPDTDGDNVTDNLDLDDDNDGIKDVDENFICESNNFASQADVIYLNEDFGSGDDRTQIIAFAGISTSYCFENGNGDQCSEGTFSPPSLNDGEYTVHHTITNGDGTQDADNDVDISVWADDYWYQGLDHTQGDTNGRMLIVNANSEPGVFYGNYVTGITVNSNVVYSFWAINIDRSDAPDVGTRENPKIAINIYDLSNNLISQKSTPELQPTNVSNTAGDWVELTGSFVAPEESFLFVLVNEQPGGLGNDLAIDDIVFKQTLCDLDRDGVADVIDLDTDGDGIPNVVELQLQDNDKDATTLYDTINTWVDANENGVHDGYENLIPLDTDGDGVPDYLDLDSDNDGIFDNVEYDCYGDTDINGDALGQGSDIYQYSSEQDGDGIHPLVDLNDDGLGTTDHGSKDYPLPKDSDSDGIPDYLDVFSHDATNNPANGSDIANTIYGSYDANNDGIIDGNTDTDKDGILDTFDTDLTLYGSPRDLDDSYTLFFDGRNDYVEDTSILGGLANATIMSWIKIEPGATGDRTILGQNNLSLQLNASGKVSAKTGSTTINYDTVLPENIWVHVAAVYDSNNGVFKLYVNGEEEASRAISGNLSADTSNLTIGKTANANASYFEGQIDEVKIFNTALTEDLLQKMVYQELDHTSNFKKGAIIPYEIDPNLNTSILRYFKMDGYKGDILDDKKTTAIDEGSGAKIYNVKNIEFQTAPLPYTTKADGNWANTQTWLNGDVWDITDEINNKDWAIVHLKNNAQTAYNHGTLGLIVDAGKQLDVTNDNELKNTWYLNLEGSIDLKGESQLVQTKNSELTGSPLGYIERDQQGTENYYTYNYWSSPVHSYNPNTTVKGDETYQIGQVMQDATDVENPKLMTFTSGSYNGNNTTTPITVSNRWLYKFDDRTEDDYAEWQFVGENGNLKVGEGYTMKGPGSGPLSNEQNYTFVGNPNNGTIALNVKANNEYLIGNPYPSAIDAYKFILDNPHLNGTLYFWEHYGGETHELLGYQGGYGLYNLSGGAIPINGIAAIPDPDVSDYGVATKIPKRYIPVSQGFFVKAETTGDIIFENDQRLFASEASGNSIFYKTNNKEQSNNLEDTRRKIRIGYKSPIGYKRQLLLTEDENATPDIDWGFDGELNEENIEDMYWRLNESKFTIQGTNTINENTMLPLGVKTENGGIIEIEIDSLQHIEPNFKIYLRDNGEYFNLKASKYITSINPGEINNRFEIVFHDGGLLSTDNTYDAPYNNLNVFYESSSNTLFITNPKKHKVEGIEVTNILGQIVHKKKLNDSNDKIGIPLHLKTGAYIFKIKTESKTINKKVIIND